MLRPKKVGTVGNGPDDVKQINEIKYAPILLEGLPLENKDITRDALHTQTAFARYLLEQRRAPYYFCVKGNQPTRLADIECYFSSDGGAADYGDDVSIAHGRIEVGRIWTTTALNDDVIFPQVAQVYRIEREITDKKSAEMTIEIAYGITRRTLEEASPKTVLHKLRNH